MQSRIYLYLIVSFVVLCSAEEKPIITRAPRPQPVSSETGNQSPLPSLSQTIVSAVQQELLNAQATGTLITDAANIGTGSGIFKDKTNATLNFKSLHAGSNITLTAQDDRIAIASTASGSGDVNGPTSATNTAVALFDGITGKMIKNSTATIDASGNAIITGTTNIQGQLTLNSGANTFTLPTTRGTTNQILKLSNDSGTLAWAAMSSGGDVNGPGSATDNAIARFDGTTGKAIQNSSVTIDDSGNITADGTLSLPNGTASAPALTFVADATSGINYNSCSPLSAQSRVDTHTEYTNYYSKAAALPNGTFVIVWSADDGSQTNMYMQRFNEDGAKAGDQTQINTAFNCSAYQRFGVAACSNNTFVITWTGFDGSQHNIYMRRFNADGTPATAQTQVSTEYTGSSPQIASFSDSTFIIAWQGDTGTQYNIYMRKFNADGSPATVQTQLTLDTVTSESCPSIASFSDSTFAVTFAGDDGTQDNTYVRKFNADGSPATAQTRVNTYETYDNASIASCPDNTFIVVWDGYDGSVWYVYMRKFNADGSPAIDQTQVSTQQNVDSQSVASFANNTFAIAWNGYDGTKWNIYLQTFNANVSSASDQVQVNTDAGLSTSIATSTNYSIAITWKDTNNNPIYERRYSSKTMQTSIGGTIITSIDSDGLSITGNLTTSGTTTFGNQTYTWPSNAPAAGTYLEADTVSGSDVTLAWTTPASDARVKKNITPIDSQESLDRICKLHPVEFEFIPEQKKALHIHGHNGKHAGLIAQETQEILPTVVVPSGKKLADNSPLYTIEYNEVTPYLIAAIQALKNKALAIQQQLEELKAPQPTP